MKTDIGESGDYREKLARAPMSAFQIRAVAVTAALCVLDGFDVFAITFAASSVEAEFGISKAQLGFVFSSGLIGMALGALLLAPAADRFGRRRLVILSLVCMTLGTTWSALSDSILQLGLSRLATGLGIGAMIAVINPLAAEYANARRRDICVALVNLGFPLGGVIGGFFAAGLLPEFGWRAIFISASLLSVALLLVVLAWLPEPLVGILARRDATLLSRLNAYLRRCGQPLLETAPPPVAKAPPTSALSVLGKGYLAGTLRIASIYFLFILSVFYIQTWLPSLVATAGYDPSRAAAVAVWMNLSGIVGGLAIGLLVPRFGLKAMVACAVLGAAGAIVAFGTVPPSLTALTLTAVLVGFFTIGGMANLYAVVSRSFPAEMRASGTGFVTGVGRFGSALAPAMAGVLFSLSFGLGAVSAVMAVPAVIAALLLLGVKDRTRVD